MRYISNWEILGWIIILVIGLVLLLRTRARLSDNEKSETYSEKLSRITGSLVKASEEVDQLLAELASVAKARATAAEELQVEVQKLTAHERHLKQRVEDLRAVPVPVAEHFAELMSRGERRSAWRDYVLFGLGVVLSAALSIVLRFAGLS